MIKAAQLYKQKNLSVNATSDTKKETWRKAKAGRRKEKSSTILFKRKVP